MLLTRALAGAGTDYHGQARTITDETAPPLSVWVRACPWHARPAAYQRRLGTAKAAAYISVMRNTHPRPPAAPTAPECQPDVDREQRLGFAEVIYCPGKSDAQLQAEEKKIEIPRLSEEATRFYASQNDLLIRGVDLAIQQLHDDKGGDGKLAAKVMADIFGGARGTMDDGIRQWLYTGFASAKDLERYAKETGIQVTKDSDGKVTQVEIKNADSARGALRSRMLNMLNRLEPATPSAPATPPARN